MKKLILSMLIGLSLLTVSCKKEEIKANPNTNNTELANIKIQVNSDVIDGIGTGQADDTLIYGVFNITKPDSAYEVFSDITYPHEYNNNNNTITFNLPRHNSYAIYVNDGNNYTYFNCYTTMYCNNNYIGSNFGYYTIEFTID